MRFRWTDFPDVKLHMSRCWSHETPKYQPGDMFLGFGGVEVVSSVL